MNRRRGTPGQFVLYWLARLPLVWAVLVGFGVSALLGSVEWYVRVPVIGVASLVVLGVAYLARAQLLEQMRGAPADAPSATEKTQPPRRVRRRR